VLDSITSRVGTNGNVTAAIFGVANQLATASTSPYKTPQDFADDPKVSRAIQGEVTRMFRTDDIGVFQGAFTAGADISQAFDQQGPLFGNRLEQHRDELVEAVTEEVIRGYAHNPNLTLADQMAGASERVSRRYAFAGDDVIQFGRETDAHEIFYGNRAEEMRGRAGAINTSIVNYLRSDEFREQYPDIEDSTLLEATGLAETWNRALGPALNTILPQRFEVDVEGSGIGPAGAASIGLTGVRPFRVIPIPDANGKHRIAIEYSKPGGGYSQPIVLDPKVIGNRDLQTIRDNNR